RIDGAMSLFAGAAARGQRTRRAGRGRAGRVSAWTTAARRRGGAGGSPRAARQPGGPGELLVLSLWGAMMTTRALGTHGPRVSALGLGCMGMSALYGAADEAESIATIHAALDAGITLLDTGDFYGMGHNELLVRDALRGRNREQCLLSVKF